MFENNEIKKEMKPFKPSLSACNNFWLWSKMDFDSIIGRHALFVCYNGLNATCLSDVKEKKQLTFSRCERSRLV